jgi:hypothetical protein
MGLKGCRLWAMCQPDSNVQSPTAVFGSIVAADVIREDTKPPKPPPTPAAAPAV